MALLKSTIQYRRRHNLCINCGNLSEKKRVYCKKCLMKSAKKNKKYRDDFREKGMCTKCGGNLAATNRKRCQSCLDRIKEKRQQDKNEVFNYYGKICICCGESHMSFLILDHINNDGAKHRREIRCPSGSPFYAWIIRKNFPKGFQTLCYNCNASKQILGACEHHLKNQD